MARSALRFLSASTGAVAAGLVLSAGGGCVERELVVESDPPGALVYMNDQEVGRTPFRREFEWYGTYDVTLRAEGYQTLKQETPVIAPIWMWVPFDLVAELLPIRLTDTRRLKYTLTPVTDADVEPASMFARARELQTRLESGTLTTTRPASTQPASTRPVRNRPASTRPATVAPADADANPQTQATP